MASLKGWKIPINPNLLGPLRIWIKPKTLRSNKVKNATLNNKKIIINKVLTEHIIKSFKKMHYL